MAARRLELTGQWGKVFGPLDLDFDRGGVIVLTAPPGAARTALMMAIAGRMRISGGSLRVMKHTDDQPAVFADSAICCFDEVDDILPSVTVQDLITEQLRWESHWYSWVPRAGTEELKKMCGYLFGDLPLPPIDAFVADLPELEQMLLRIGVANTGRPPLLVVGQLDQMAEDEQRRSLLERLIMLGERQSVVTADVNGEEFAEDVELVIGVPDLLEFKQRSKVAREMKEEEEAEEGKEGSKEREAEVEEREAEEREDDGGEDEGENES